MKSILELRDYLEQAVNDETKLDKEKSLQNVHIKRRKESMDLLMNDIKEVLKLDEHSVYNL